MSAVDSAGSDTPRVYRDVMGWVYCDVIVVWRSRHKARRVPASPEFQRALGAAVKARRLELGLTQEQLSLRAELHQRWLSNVETGVRNPSYASLRRLAGGLDLTTSELIRRAEASESAGPGA